MTVKLCCAACEKELKIIPSVEDNKEEIRNYYKCPTCIDIIVFIKKKK